MAAVTIYSDFGAIAFFSHCFPIYSVMFKVMLKILQARLQQYVKLEPPDVQAGFRKSRGTRGQIANIRWIIEKAKTSTSASLTTLKSLNVWITTNCGTFLER